MAPPKTRARDRSSLRHYRIELPNLIDDMGLSVYAFRLYVHLKRVAEDEGSCWQSARTLAEACSMSAGQVSKAKDELEQKQLIARHPKILRGGIGDDITIVDIWPKNFAHYAPEGGETQKSDHHTITYGVEVITTRSLSESDHHTITTGESDHQVIAETIKRSPGDPKKDQYHIESHDPTTTTESVVVDDFFLELRQRRVGPKKAREIASMPIDHARVLAVLDSRPDPDNMAKLGGLINDIIDGVAFDAPPRARAVAAPLTATKPNVPDRPVAPAEMLRQARARNDSS
jgi:hypothetical protein